MDLSAIWAESGRNLNDPYNDRWKTDVLTTRANLAQVQIQGYTNAIKTIESLTPTLATHAVSLDADTMNVLRVTKTLSDGSIKPLSGISIQELDFRYPDWNQWVPDDPMFFYYDASSQTINLVPAPAAPNVVTNGITVTESRLPTDLVNPTDVPFDSNNQMVPYHMAIVNWVVARCWMDDGSPEALAKSRFYKSGNMMNPGEYEKEVGRIMAEFDVPEIVPTHILYRPQGGRIGSVFLPNKSNPLPY